MSPPSLAQPESAATALRSTPGLVLRRKCSCGNRTIAGGDCKACARQNGWLQRKSAGATAAEAPRIVHEVLRSPGQPLDAATRAFMEPRFSRNFSSVRASAQPMRSAVAIGPADDAFEREADAVAARIATGPAAARGRDFGAVRVHTGAIAAESARAVDAQAYTVGRDIVFGAGQHQPRSAAGQRLIAHELTHVVQQCDGALRRKGGATARLRNFTEDALQAYLRVLDATGDIERDHNSDNKARQVVNEWIRGSSPYALTHKRKALLIREMQAGATGNSDEQAILEILERSYNFELSYIYGAGGITVAGLDSNFHGGEQKQLQDFYDRRFEGGYQGVLNGNLKPVGLPLLLRTPRPPPGQPVLPDPTQHEYWNLACVLGILCSEDRDIVAQLPKLEVRMASRIIEHYWKYENGTWNAKMRARRAAHREGVLIFESVTTCAQAAQSIIHEVRHHNQPKRMDKAQREIDAYTFVKDWAIARGLPGRPEFRTTKPNSSEQIVDTSKIETSVAADYSGSVKSAPTDRIIGHLPNDNAQILHADGSISDRPANEGEEYQDTEMTHAGLKNLPPVDSKVWVCPAEPKK